MRKVWSKTPAPYGGRYFIANTQNWRKRKIHYAAWISIQFCQKKKRNEDLRTKTNQLNYATCKVHVELPCSVVLLELDWKLKLKNLDLGAPIRAIPSSHHLRRGCLLRFRSSNAAHISTAQYDGCSGTLVQTQQLQLHDLQGPKVPETPSNISLYIF